MASNERKMKMMIDERLLAFKTLQKTFFEYKLTHEIVILSPPNLLTDDDDDKDDGKFYSLFFVNHRRLYST